VLSHPSAPDRCVHQCLPERVWSNVVREVPDQLGAPNLGNNRKMITSMGLSSPSTIEIESSVRRVVISVGV